MRIAVAGSTGLVGSRVVTAAEVAGHEVVGLSPSTGVDLVAGPAPDLTGVDAVVDVTQGPQDAAGGTAFFEAVAGTLDATGVACRVLLSIVGVDEAADEVEYYTAKLAHERATLAGGRDVRILRATQFLDFPGQWLGWNRDGDRVVVPDMPTQPVDVDEIVRVLLELAVSPSAAPLTELAGPREERLPALVAAVAPDVAVEVVPVGPAIAGGALLPNAGARIAGQDFATWLAAHGVAA